MNVGINFQLLKGMLLMHKLLCLRHSNSNSSLKKENPAELSQLRLRCHDIKWSQLVEEQTRRKYCQTLNEETLALMHLRLSVN